MAHGEVLHGTQHFPTVAGAQPAQLGQEEAAVGRGEFDRFRTGVAEAVVLAPLLEAREAALL
ncbi:hypothetical protein [Chthonomonas calidirosea]|uniref:hypothetical protein n=1 Tax=Chthonomonas calidirosea TaxID=454171 RepID=UPI000948F74B|nr:hypothetical protein [Chthonomonas calidirosea]